MGVSGSANMQALDRELAHQMMISDDT